MKQHLFILILLLSTFSGMQSVAQQTVSIYVTNKGDIPVEVVCAKESVLAFGQGTMYHLNGWYTVYPKSQAKKSNGSKSSTVMVEFNESIYRDFYLAFNIKDKDGNVGFVKYNLKSYSFEIEQANLWQCASLKAMDDFDPSSDCQTKANRLAIPFYHRVSPQISFAPDHQDIYIEIYPKATDRIVSYLNTNNIPKTENTVPDEPEKRTRSIDQIVAACEASTTRYTYDEPWRKSNNCGCKGAYIYYSDLTNDEIIKLINNWRSNYSKVVLKNTFLKEQIEEKCTE